MAAAAADEQYDADDEVDDEDDDDAGGMAKDGDERRQYNAFVCSKIDQTWVCPQARCPSA